MAIHRDIKQCHNIGETHTSKELGRLFITIDDLEALINILQATKYSPSKPVICFGDRQDHRYVDSPQDIATLSQIELETLYIKYHDVIVRLGTRKASIEGPAGLNGTVYEEWAITRRRFDIDTFIGGWNYVLLYSTAGLLIPTSLLLIIRLHPPGYIANLFKIGYGLVVILLFTIAIRTAYWRVAKVTIYPLTLKELRAERAQRFQHWRTVGIAFMSTAVALIALVLSHVLTK